MRETFLFLLFITLPLSLILWIINAFISSTLGGRMIEPSRWLSATLLPVIVAWWALKRKSLTFTGALCGLVVGFIITLGSYVFFVDLLVFLVSSSKATKYRSYMKSKFESDYKEGGQRNWIQVLCNGAVGSLMSWLYIVDCGCGEKPVDLIYSYRCSWLSVAVLGAIACCNGDTWSSEFGSVLSIGDPVLLTNLKPVPRGTNGGISLIGLVFSLLGGLFVGIGHYITLLMFVSTPVLVAAPPQWPVMLVGAAGGLIGSLIDSLMGATMQYSGITPEGKIVGRPGDGIKHISGLHMLDNHAVNLLSSLLTALLLPRVALMIMHVLVL